MVATISSEQATLPHEPVSARILTYSTGWRAIVLSVGDDLPCPWVAAHLLDLTLKPLAIRTVRNRSLAIARLLLFCKSRDIDYVTRCQGHILSELELADLALHMRGDPSNPRTTAESDYAAAVAFLCSTTARLRQPDDPNTALLLGAFRSSAKAHGPRVVKRSASPRLGMLEDQREIFLTAIMPGPNNRGVMAFRNYVLMRTAYDLGMRTGELLGLKVYDLDLIKWPAKLAIIERITDPDDKRSLPAMAKTGGRELPLSPQLSLAYQQLIDDREALPHPYVFCNYDGGPLSEGGLRMIYRDVVHKHPSLEKLCNHMLRHDWNDRWNRMASKERWDKDESERLQKDVMGWSADSDMVARYGIRSTHELATARHLRMQEEDLRRNGGSQA